VGGNDPVDRIVHRTVVARGPLGLQHGAVDPGRGERRDHRVGVAPAAAPARVDAPVVGHIAAPAIIRPAAPFRGRQGDAKIEELCHAETASR